MPTRSCSPRARAARRRGGLAHGLTAVGSSAVDITATIERKIAALLSHRSQIADPEKLAELVRSWTAANATSFGLPEGHFAESFQVVDTR